MCNHFEIATLPQKKHQKNLDSPKKLPKVIENFNIFPQKIPQKFANFDVFPKKTPQKNVHPPKQTSNFSKIEVFTIEKIAIFPKIIRFPKIQNRDFPQNHEMCRFERVAHKCQPCVMILMEVVFIKKYQILNVAETYLVLFIEMQCIKMGCMVQNCFIFTIPEQNLYIFILSL